MGVAIEDAFAAVQRAIDFLVSNDAEEGPIQLHYAWILSPAARTNLLMEPDIALFANDGSAMMTIQRFIWQLHAGNALNTVHLFDLFLTSCAVL